MSLKNSSRTLDIPVSYEQLAQQCEPLLRTLGFVKENEEVVNISFGDFSKSVPGETIPVRFTIRKEKEVQVIIDNG